MGSRPGSKADQWLPHERGFQSVSCLCPHSLQTNLTRVAPFSAEIRLGAPHLPHLVSMRVLPCFTTMGLRAMASRIRRSASSRIWSFDIRPYLPGNYHRGRLIACASYFATGEALV